MPLRPASLKNTVRSRTVVAMDPGDEQTALVEVDIDTGQVVAHHLLPNEEMLSLVKAMVNARYNANPAVPERFLAIEMIASYGMAVGATVFDTCVWIGRFIEAWASRGGKYERVFRRDVKLHLCGSSKAKDANVRQAIIDEYGGNKKAVGNKKNPGPLYGIKADEWAALGVALTWTKR